MRIRLVCFLALFLVVLAALPSFGQSAPSDSQNAPSSTPADSTANQTKPADPQPLPMPSMSGPLQTAPPREMEGGKLAVTGILSGIGLTEGNHITGDSSTHWDVSNAQVFVQKTTGWWQFYLQGGAYNLPAIGLPFLSTADTVKNIYGPFPQVSSGIRKTQSTGVYNSIGPTRSSAHHSAGMMAFTLTATHGCGGPWLTLSIPRTPWPL